MPELGPPSSLLSSLSLWTFGKLQLETYVSINKMCVDTVTST